MYTNMLNQFREMKKKHPDAILLFRNSYNHPETYDLFQEDAIFAGYLLNKKTTQIDTTTVFLSFPHTSLDMYLPVFVRQGCRVAICEQLEDPRKTKKLVKRGIPTPQD